MIIDMTFEKREELIRRDEREEGIREGMREGIQQTILQLIRDNDLSLEKGAEKLGLTKEELQIGDLVTIGTEEFYVIPDENGTLSVKEIHDFFVEKTLRFRSFQLQIYINIIVY